MSVKEKMTVVADMVRSLTKETRLLTVEDMAQRADEMAKAYL